MKKNETKREKFVRIAEARTNKIITMIRLLGNCSNKGSYEYDESDVQKMFSTIDKELRLAKQKYSSNYDEDTFKF